MCVCTILSGSRSLTKFKVDEDYPNKNSSHLRTLSLNYLSAVLIKFLKMERFNKLLSRSQTHRRNACRGCEFKIIKALEIMGTSRNSLCLPHVCRCMYPDFVTCEDQSAHRTALSALLFLEQNIKHLVGPDLGPTVC